MRLLIACCKLYSSNLDGQCFELGKRNLNLLRHSVDKRIQVLVEIALTNDCGCIQMARRQEKVARRLGLTGAEVDAARAGRSFDVRSDAAVRLACAAQSSARSAVSEARNRAARAGFDESDLIAIERLAKTIKLSTRVKG